MWEKFRSLYIRNIRVAAFLSFFVILFLGEVADNAYKKFILGEQLSGNDGRWMFYGLFLLVLVVYAIRKGRTR